MASSSSASSSITDVFENTCELAVVVTRPHADAVFISLQPHLLMQLHISPKQQNLLPKHHIAMRFSGVFYFANFWNRIIDSLTVASSPLTMTLS